MQIIMRDLTMSKQKIQITDFKISSLTNGSFEVTLPSSNFHNEFDTFLFSVNSGGIELSFKGATKEKTLILDNVPIQILTKLRRLKLIKVGETPSGGALSGLSSMFVNERFYKSVELAD